MILGLLPRGLLAITVALTVAAASPSSSDSAVYRVGPRLGEHPASLSTTDGLGYPGIDTAVPPAPDAPNGVVHTAHYGADTAIWNDAVEHRSGAMPRDGQAIAVKLEGCAERPSGAPEPLTDIHFQTLAPQGRGVKVALSTGVFPIQVCGQAGADESTVSVYKPVNLCVHKGDYIGFNDEGGFAEPYYRAGVAYYVLAPVAGSEVDSFLRGGGTNNGAYFDPGERGQMDGFANRTGVQLMLQVELGTGADARYVCPGGVKDRPPQLPPLRVSRQTDGINRSRVVAVAVYCRPASGCHGGATLQLPGAGTVGRRPFSLPGNTTSHLPIRVTPEVLRRIRREHGVRTRIFLRMARRTFTQQVTIKIL